MLKFQGLARQICQCSSTYCSDLSGDLPALYRTSVSLTIGKSCIPEVGKFRLTNLPVYFGIFQRIDSTGVYRATSEQLLIAKCRIVGLHRFRRSLRLKNARHLSALSRVMVITKSRLEHLNESAGGHVFGSWRHPIVIHSSEMRA